MGDWCHLEGGESLGGHVQEVRRQVAAHPGGIALDGSAPAGLLDGLAASGVK